MAVKRIIGVLLVGLCAVGAFAQTERAFRYESGNRRDPLVSLVTKDGKLLPGAKTVGELATETIAEIRIGGIFWEESGNSVVLINGKPLRELERYEDFQILKIEKDRVIVQRSGNVLELFLQKRKGDTQ
ncbi:MAG: hypothetical protein NC924_05910 [Candidatus Omnitrophica bacterium]|nr:hypothetical protein [Candidatus Omnitrophota bacterium]